MSDSIVYLYGFTPANADVLPRALSGVHGAAVRMLDVAELRAIVSDVPSDEYSAAAIDQQIQDLNWVGARGLEHERVVAWFVDHADILPAPLFTLFSSEDALKANALQRDARLKKQIERLAGKREWDLKVSYDQRRLAENAAIVIESVKQIDREIASASAGKRYLLEKKRADVVKRETPRAARSLAESLIQELVPHASVATMLAIPRSDEMPVVLNAALLVRREKEPALRATAAERIDALRSAGIDAQLTGPWAPYRFADMTDDAGMNDEHTR
jgi:hypothetical protein